MTRAAAGRSDRARSGLTLEREIIVHVSKILIPTAILFATVAVTAAVASATPTLSTNEGCYLVGQRVAITGSGFAASQMYQVAVDGIDFGVSTTDAAGAFTASLIPGGLGANIVEEIHGLSASDGTSLTRTSFTVTRATGARILAGTGTAARLHAPFQVWGFALDHGKPAAGLGAPRLPVYVHYLNPRKIAITTVPLGHTRGQCGYLRTAARRVFPFIPSRGSWTLQVDSQPIYAAHPVGPVAKITVRVS
ncbi:MAG: hypothetical protein M3065_10215 [Actinomycetota bacterium]|nr:hypothetical protein [Actinomycetota bacterium]